MDLPKGFHEEVIEARESNTILKNEVSISPISKDGSNFETHVLYIAKDGTVKFKPTLGLGIFALAIFTAFCILLGFGINGYIKDEAFYFIKNFVGTIVGLVLFGASIYVIYKFLEPIVFDKKRGIFYRGYKKNSSIDFGNCVKLSDIIAIQLLGEIIYHDDGSYSSFELNLVLSNLRRINVTDHNNLKGLIDDAQVLSDFLNIPIWHAGSD